MNEEHSTHQFGSRTAAATALILAAFVGAPSASVEAVTDLPDAAASAPGARAAVPADFVQLVDDTGALSVSIPPAWVDIDTAPGTNDDGTTMPWISASTDFAVYRETFDVSGTVFIGVTHTTDLQSWIDRLGQPGGCETNSVEPYDDGAFQGLAATYDRCGPSRQATFLLIAANVAGDTTRTYVLQAQAASRADVALFDPILASVSAVGIISGSGAGAEEPIAEQPSAAVPDQTTPPVLVTLPDGTPIVPATAPGTGGTPAPDVASVFTPTNVLAEGALQITDDSRTITVAVPPDWAQSATAPAPDGAGGSLAQILASPDLAGFTSGGLAAPGVRFTARPFAADTAAAVTAVAAGLPCTAGAVQPYSDPVFTGHILQLTDCGGTTTRIYLIEASPADQSMTASLLVQVTDPDDSDLQTVLSSFDAASSTQTPASTPSDSATVPVTTSVAVTTAATPTSITTTVPVTTSVAVTTAATPTSITTTVPVTTSVASPTVAAPPSVVAPTTAVGVAASTTAPGGVFTPPVAFPDDTLGITDDTGLLRIGVPPAWSDRLTAPFTGADGTALPYIAASTNLDEFLHDPAAGPDPFTAPGVVYIGLPYTADTAGLLTQLTQGQACTPGPVQQYADSAFSGHIQEFTACGGTQTRLFVVVANPGDGSFTAALTVQITDDPAALNTVLATFNYDAAVPPPGAAVPTTTGG